MYSSLSLENNALKLKNACLASSYNGTRFPQIYRGKTCTAASYAHQHQMLHNGNSQPFQHPQSMQSKQLKQTQSRYMPCASDKKNNLNNYKRNYTSKDDRSNEMDLQVAYVKSQILDTILEEKCVECLPFPPSHLLALYPPSYQKDLICYYYQLQKLYPDLYNQYVQYYEQYYKPLYMANGNTACVFQKGAFIPASANSFANGAYNSVNQIDVNGVANSTIDNINQHHNNQIISNRNNNNNISTNVILDKQQQQQLREQRQQIKKQQQLMKKLQKQLLSNQKKQLQLIQKLAEQKSKERQHDELQRRLQAQRLQLRQQQHDIIVQSLADKKIQPQVQTNASNTAKVTDASNNVVNRNVQSPGLSRQASNLSTTSLTRQSSIRRQNSMRRNEINKMQNEGGGLQRLPSMHK